MLKICQLYRYLKQFSISEKPSVDFRNPNVLKTFQYLINKFEANILKKVLTSYLGHFDKVFFCSEVQYDKYTLFISSNNSQFPPRGFRKDSHIHFLTPRTIFRCHHLGEQQHTNRQPYHSQLHVDSYMQFTEIYSKQISQISLSDNPSSIKDQHYGQPHLEDYMMSSTIKLNNF